MAKVSIIVPNYNNEQFLKRCLNSLKYQTEKDMEFLLVDDASTDNSLEVMEEYHDKDKRFKIISLSKNEGVSIARNKGIDASTGEYIGFVDSDDYIDYDYYEVLMSAIEESRIPISISNSVFPTEKSSNHVYNFQEDDTLLSTGGVSACMRLFTREIIGEDRFIEHCRFEDTAFTYLMHMKSEKLIMTAYSEYYYCSDNENSFSKKHWHRLQSILDSLKIADYLQEKVNENSNFSLYRDKIDSLELEFLLDSAEYIRFSPLAQEEQKDLLNHLDVLIDKKYADRRSMIFNFGEMMLERYFNDVARSPYLPMDLKECEENFRSKVKTFIKRENNQAFNTSPVKSNVNSCH